MSSRIAYQSNDEFLKLVKWRTFINIGYLICLVCLSIAFVLVDQIAKMLIGFCLVTGVGVFIDRFRNGRRLRANIKYQVEQLEIAKEDSRIIEELFAMTDMLQAADEHQDTGAILKATASRLLPGHSGALYVFNNSRDRLDLTCTWSEDDDYNPPEQISPHNCWALKRGKPHINDPVTKTLLCCHHTPNIASVEVPMSARGKIHGLLVISLPSSESSFNDLLGIRRLARAMADSMSLALSNIALREKLRTQSLRDPLTGLYNRRYMEDSLERIISLAERARQPTSVLMIDLDHFKKINDEHGHAKGDAILRDVASQLVGGLRPSDVVSRYGGEELVVILPNCPLSEALLKADQLRLRIESLSEPHNAAVSASIGVATIPDSANGLADIVARADNALYAAKSAGRNCVMSASLQNGPSESFKPSIVSA